MTDRKNIGLQHKVDGMRDNHSINSKLSQKMKTKRRVIGLKDARSPSCNKSYICRKDFRTPKRRPRIRFNGSYSGDSPNDTESLQDIIWDTNSPTQNLNEKGVRDKVIEISEIVNRIAPKVDKSGERDSVLQWIGDNAIPCTPEIRQPRIKRISSRQSNVEDLMKLAKQFDINMTRQDKEKQQITTEEQKKLKPKCDETSRAKLSSMPSTSGCFTQARQEEEELQALFDGPTQHLSGRLSPPSANCTPDSLSVPVASAEPEPSTIKDAPVNVPKASEVDFDDDWDNDDLFNDSFVLEITQNSLPLNVAQKPTTAEPECSSRNIAQPKCDSVTKTHLSVSNVRDVCLQTKHCTNTKTLSEGRRSVQGTSRLKPLVCLQEQTSEKLLKTSLVTQGKRPFKANNKATKGQPSSNFSGGSKEDLRSLFDSDALWNDDDDDLLCQACDDVLERISTSQEQQNHSTETTSKAPSSADLIHAQTVDIKSKNHPVEPTKSVRAFARSNSVPSSSGSSVYSAMPNKVSTGSGSYQYRQAQNKVPEAKNDLEPISVSVRTTDTSMMTIQQNTRVRNSHQGTFKRHLSDSGTLTNKVFVPSTTVKCSAAEIEMKKQEALARRRLRMQACQKQGAPK